MKICVSRIITLLNLWGSIWNFSQNNNLQVKKTVKKSKKIPREIRILDPGNESWNNVAKSINLDFERDDHEETPDDEEVPEPEEVQLISVK